MIDKADLFLDSPHKLLQAPKNMRKLSEIATFCCNIVSKFIEIRRTRIYF